jgi:multidrug efflux pump subunit AcrB
MSNNSRLPIYLQNLKFDEKLRQSFLAKFLANIRLTVLIILTLFIAGAFSFFQLPRQLNPDVDLSIVNVVTVLPGASPLDVENLVTKKIEKEVKDVANIDTITSNSSNSVSVITIQFLGDTNSDKALEDVRQKVDLVSDLPTDANKPTVSKLDINDSPIWQVALTGDTDVLSLTRLANRIKDDLEQTPGLRKGSISGNEEEEIVIELDKKALSELNLSSGQIAQMIRSNDLSFPAGSVTVHDTQYTLTIDNQLKTVRPKSDR